MRWLCVSLILLIVLAGCQSVTQEKAQVIARVFIATQVKLFARANDSMNTNVSDSDVRLVLESRKSQGYDFTYNMSGIVDGAQRSALIVISVSKQGKVISLNGKPIPQNGK